MCRKLIVFLVQFLGPSAHCPKGRLTLTTFLTPNDPSDPDDSNDTALQFDTRRLGALEAKPRTWGHIPNHPP